MSRDSFTRNPQPPLGFPLAYAVETDVTCTEVIVNRFPFLRPLARLLVPGAAGHGKRHSGDRRASIHAVTRLKINDGSCIRNLQVRLIEHDFPPPPPLPRTFNGFVPWNSLCIRIFSFPSACLKGFEGTTPSNERSHGALSLSLSVQLLKDVDIFQVLVDPGLPDAGQLTVGASILVEGVLRLSTPGKGVIELVAEKVLHLGVSDPDKYPFGRQRLSPESSRRYPHFRARTTTVALITRIRNSLSSATSTFFQKNGFFNVQMPVITSSCPNSLERFQATTLFDGGSNMCRDMRRAGEESAVNLDVVRSAIHEKTRRIEELKRSNSNVEVLNSALQDLERANELARQLETQQKSASGGRVDFSKDFFSQPAYLSTSAALHLESYACALCNVYTFGPVFQAKAPKSTTFLAEMWMVEVELAFSELENAMDCAEDYLKFLCQSVLESCLDEMNFVTKEIDKGCADQLQLAASTPFQRITYTDAVEALKKVGKKKSPFPDHIYGADFLFRPPRRRGLTWLSMSNNEQEETRFETEIQWGADLSREQESYLVEEMYKCPVILYNHPKELRPFYARLRDDGRTVSSFDIIMPKVGVLVRGCQKEERLDVLNKRMEAMGLAREQYGWYLELRQHGTVRHSGFGVAFEGMAMLVTGVEDASDVIPFPRTSGKTTTP
ncbi:unnamed protein product [Spirodela intermedia]|uniref:Aminoacyl-tRNA synthetase class II (D/K/N) domain-containing protein n=1 Tax=Spirodela intermedia TaxID=51605 RepID=A0A7I8L4Z5_SPIIN|nr:unnamed protein product [Spirodela intermedia]